MFYREKRKWYGIDEITDGDYWNLIKIKQDAMRLRREKSGKDYEDFSPNTKSFLEISQ